MNRPMHNPPLFTSVRAHRRPNRAAFSLVEVTLALGITVLALVAVLGVMPTAMSAGRQSFDQNRAATIADTLFASFRSQPFGNVCYLDSQFQPDGATTAPSSGLNLNLLTSSSTDDKKFYASFLNPGPVGNDADAYGEQRRLCFTPVTDPRRGDAAIYLVTLHFNNAPAGMAIQPAAAAGTQEQTAGSAPAEANQVEVVVTPLADSTRSYSFISTVANRF